jgi:hypothetical protein
MRPTLAEQLRGLRRILDVAVAPVLTDDYASEALAGVQRALAMLETRERDVLPFLRWDNAQTARLLHDARQQVPLTGSIAPAGSVDGTDIAAVDAENERLRGLLAGVVPALAAASEADPASAAATVYAEVVAHLRARIARYPYVTTGVLPSR